MIRAQRPDAQNTRPPLEAKPPLEAIRLPCFFYQKSIGFRVRPPGIHTTLEVIMTMTTSRRAVLAGAAALPALSLPALAIPAQVDPVFAAIEEHRRLNAEYSALTLARDELEGRLPEEIHNSGSHPRISLYPERELTTTM